MDNQAPPLPIRPHADESLPLCPDCHGVGSTPPPTWNGTEWVYGVLYEKCQTCNGTGRITNSENAQ